jgi:hypothetical protein
MQQRLSAKDFSAALQVLLSESNARPLICTITGSALPGLGKTRVLLEASGALGGASSLMAANNSSGMSSMGGAGSLTTALAANSSSMGGAGAGFGTSSKALKATTRRGAQEKGLAGFVCAYRCLEKSLAVLIM